MTEQEIEKKVDESIAWVEERVSLDSYAKELIRLQFIHRIKQLTLTDVSQQRELLEGFVDWFNTNDKTQAILSERIEAYIKTL